MSLSPGTRFGPYEVVAQIGAGGMGEVYRAMDTDLGRAVAIKVLRTRRTNPTRPRSGSPRFRVWRTADRCRAVAAMFRGGRGDERELYYLAPDGAMTSVGITVDSGIQAGPPTRLFQTRILGTGGCDRYDVTSDGQRFLLLEPPESASAPPITVVTNWTSLLRR